MDKNELKFLDTIVYLDEESNVQIKSFPQLDSQSAFMYHMLHVTCYMYKSVCPKRIKNSIKVEKTTENYYNLTILCN